MSLGPFRKMVGQIRVVFQFLGYSTLGPWEFAPPPIRTGRRDGRGRDGEKRDKRDGVRDGTKGDRERRDKTESGTGLRERESYGTGRSWTRCKGTERDGTSLSASSVKFRPVPSLSNPFRSLLSCFIPLFPPVPPLSFRSVPACPVPSRSTLSVLFFSSLSRFIPLCPIPSL